MHRCAALLFLPLLGCAQTSRPPLPAASEEVESRAPERWRAKAADYLDARVGHWLDAPPQVANFGCAMNCHTTFPAVLAQAHLPAERTGRIDEARQRFEARLSGDVTPYYGRGDDTKATQSHATEAVLVAAALSFDASPRPTQAEALERMWTRQDADGSWAWLDFGLDPWEHDAAFGAAMAALAAGRLGETEGEGASRLRQRARALITTASLHDRAGLLWASSQFGGLLTDDQAAAIATDLKDAQRPGGGVSLGRLVGGSDRKPDGYATAWVTLALCRSGRESDAARAGQAWLRGHQSRDGSWPGRSVNGSSRTAQRYMTDAATAYAVLALDCEA